MTVKILSKGDVSAGERAVVTVVDEGINILTSEKVPDPIGGLSVERGGWHPLYDIYRRLYLQKNLDRRRFHWGTTGENAHALLALGAYYRANGVREGDAKVRLDEGSSESHLSAGAKRRFTGGGDIGIENRGAGDAYVSLHQFALPEVETVTNRHHVVKVSRRFMTSEGFEADLDNLTRGELLIGEITLTADRDYDFSDLVVQELLPACFEPDRKEVAAVYGRRHGSGNSSWVLRSDVRDDRVTVFSRPFRIDGDRTKGAVATFHYAVRVITPGSFTLPGTSVEAMYAPGRRPVRKPMTAVTVPRTLTTGIAVAVTVRR